MEKLIDISGYVNTEEDLLETNAYEGEFYNVLTPIPFTTYRKTDEKIISDLHATTDIIGWFENKAELESNIRKPNDKDIYITGSSAPYTRWKAHVFKNEITWNEDGESDKKIIRKFASVQMLNLAKLEPEEDNFYSVGKEAPFKLYGSTPYWENVGMYISHYGDNFQNFRMNGFKIGEIGYNNGLFYLYNNDKEWTELKVIEPLENYKKHIYKNPGNDRLISIREGWKLGTLEFFEPKE